MKLLLLLGLVACTTTEDRPETLAYITEAVLAPNCASAECHSAMKAQSTDVFDSVAAAQSSIAKNHLVNLCLGNDDVPGCEPASASYLVTVISRQDDEGDRMPLDVPLSNKDIVLIAQWIRDGAPGYEPAAGYGGD
jgi:hypothetical protein